MRAEYFTQMLPQLQHASLEAEGGQFHKREIPTKMGATLVFVYHPNNAVAPLPMLVNLHGGGFVNGDPYIDDKYCREIANVVGCVVVSVDYKRAPEFPFPAGLEECYDVVKWLHENPDELGVDADRIAIAGHSSGGNFAAAICLLAKARREFRLAHQTLDYPPLDLATDPGQKPNGSIAPDVARAFDAAYVPRPEDRNNPLVSPVYANDVSGLPPALVITAERDTLRDEAKRYADKLAQAGVPTLYKDFAGCEHAFTHTEVPADQARAAWSLIHCELIKAFAVSEK